jgi:hypothetical protein
MSDPNFLRFLVRVPEQSGPDLHWKDEWLSPAPLEKAKGEVPVPDELRLQRIKKRGFRQSKGTSKGT